MSTESIRVLLVEDSLVVARMLHAGLEMALPGKFNLTHVRRLDEALEHLWKENSDVVLLDLGLPDSHGIDTLVLTRAQAPRVPIIVLTGSEDEALGDQALHEGAQDYLVKGQVDSTRLARSMRYAIARKAAALALVGEEFALGTVALLRRSRERLIAEHERARHDISVLLLDTVREDLLALSARFDEFLGKLSPSPEPNHLLGDAISGLTRKIERRVVALGQQLYPSTLAEGLVPTVRSLGDRFETILDIEIEIDEVLESQEAANSDFLPDKVKLAAYRIAEEALSNTIKHAEASKVVLRLDASREGWLCVSVRDDGRSFDPEIPSHGLGIGMMHDYAEALDGECLVRSEQGQGTEVWANLPITIQGTELLGILEKGEEQWKS